MRFAYADPPYLGMGRMYLKYHPDALEWDRVEKHAELICRLVEEFPDGWAMSASAPSLRQLLPLCPEGVRIASWVKPFAAFRPNVTPAYAWEPVIFRGGNRKTRDEWSGRDWVSAMPPVFSGENRDGIKGMKPAIFCFWLFDDLLGIREGDELVDLFPGSGAVGRALDSWRRQRRIGFINVEDLSTWR